MHYLLKLPLRFLIATSLFTFAFSRADALPAAPPLQDSAETVAVEDSGADLVFLAPLAPAAKVALAKAIPIVAKKIAAALAKKGAIAAAKKGAGMAVREAAKRATNRSLGSNAGAALRNRNATGSRTRTRRREPDHCYYQEFPADRIASADLPWIYAYKHALNQLIIREGGSSKGKPRPPNLAKWAKDAGEDLSLVKGPYRGYYLVRLKGKRSATELESLILRMYASDATGKPGVGCRYASITPNWILDKLEALTAPTDAGWAKQWNARMDAPQGAQFQRAWQELHDYGDETNAHGPAAPAPVVVAVVDDFFATPPVGLPPGTAPELSFLAGYSVERRNANVACRQDTICHGTQVASVLAARARNGIGIAGALGIGVSRTWDTAAFPILPVSVDDGHGDATLWNIWQGIDYASGAGTVRGAAAPVPARVISLSVGQDASCSSFLQESVSEARARGVFLVAAVGNSPVAFRLGTPAPASCKGVIQATGHTRDGRAIEDMPVGDLGRAFSAPAESLPVFTGYDFPNNIATGSSIAAPQIAAAIALMLRVNPALTLEDVLRILARTGKPATAARPRPALDAAAAVKAVIDPQAAESEDKPPKNIHDDFTKMKPKGPFKPSPKGK